MGRGRKRSTILKRRIKGQQKKKSRIKRKLESALKKDH